MDNNSNTTDTPEIADFFQEINPLADQGSSNSQSTVEEAFQSPQEAAPSNEGQPAVEETAAEEPVQPSNDEKRFEYWQSKADKLQNQINVMQQGPPQQAVMPQQPPVQQQPAKQEFPPPPERPKKPSGFNRSDAYSDPDSKSAQYLDDIDSWRDDMDEYNVLKSEYDSAVMQERIQSMEADKQREFARQQAMQQRNAQLNDVNEYVQGHYGLTQEEAREFIQDMSKPESLTMENLVQLYRLKKGTNAVPGQSETAEPSDAFKQTQIAQQVPSPMGVVPGQTGAGERSDSDQIMDSMLSNYKKNNPW